MYGSVGPCSIRSCLSGKLAVAGLVRASFAVPAELRDLVALPQVERVVLALNMEETAEREAIARAWHKDVCAQDLERIAQRCAADRDAIELNVRMKALMVAPPPPLPRAPVRGPVLPRPQPSCHTPADDCDRGGQGARGPGLKALGGTCGVVEGRGWTASRMRGSRAPPPHAHRNAARQGVDDRRTEVRGQQEPPNDPCSTQHNCGTPTTGHC